MNLWYMRLWYALREMNWRRQSVQPAWALVDTWTRVKFVAYILLLRRRPM